MKRCVLGLDTSNYTTSLGIVDEDLRLVANIKRPLPVKAGECGLRQSDAVFAHIKNLPEVFSEAKPYLETYALSAVGVSERPRNHAGSYMPCFLSGVSSAVSIACTADVPLFRWSHQCGHLMAALYGADAVSLIDAPFGAFHVSGGTTELVRAVYSPDGFSCDVVGGSRDLHAGQVIDRIGVRMGLSFPAGPALEQLAEANTDQVPRRKPALDGCYCHLSGLENLAADLYHNTGNRELTAAFVLDYIGASLLGMSQAYLETYGEMPLVYAGGVLSNARLKKRLGEEVHGYFAPPSLSADNAVGIAVLTARRVFASPERKERACIR